MGKKIAILTMQRDTNYGSFLQAFAVKKILEGMGAESVFLDKKLGVALVSKYKLQCGRFFRNFIRLFKYNLRLPDIYRYNKDLIRVISKAGYQFMGFTSEMNYDGEYDVVVIGSDEVFNCTDKVNGFRPQLLGEGIKAPKVVSYAASCGYTTLERIDRFGLRERVQADLNKFYALSVRDNNSYSIVRSLTNNKHIVKSLDPVLIYDYKGYLKEEPLDENYILIFSYFDRIANHPDEVIAIKKFAKEKGKKIISIYAYLTWADENIAPSPFEVLTYFKYADYIFTDTFHGTVFSVKMNRPFITFVRSSNYNKLYYLLERFNLTSREVKDLSMINEVMDTPIDYVHINSIIEEETLSSLDFFRKNVISE